MSRTLSRDKIGPGSYPPDFNPARTFIFYNDRQDREHIRCTVAHELAHCHGKCLGAEHIRAQCIREDIFIVSSNLGGLDKDNYFWGGSSILGPFAKTWGPHYYAGMPFTAEGADE